MYSFVNNLTQLAHDVVTTLGFGCILVATSDYVVTTSWFWSRFPDENLKVFQYHYNFLFPKICNIALQFHFLINKIYSVCVNTKCSLKWWIFEDLELVAWTEKRDFWSCVVHWSETAPFFLALNLIGSWFNYFLCSGNQNTGV